MEHQQTNIESSKIVVPTRRFTLLDAIILIAITSLGFACNRWALQDFSTFDAPFDRQHPVHKLFNLIMWNVVPHLALWSLGVLLLEFLVRRRPFREVMRQPGMAACSAASLAILFEAAWYVPFKVWHPFAVLPGILIMHECERVGFAVSGAWLVLLAGSLWKSENNWLDRLGQVLGCSWIAVSIFFNFRNLFL